MASASADAVEGTEDRTADRSLLAGTESVAGSSWPGRAENGLETGGGGAATAAGIAGAGAEAAGGGADFGAGAGG
ncbi:MAG TPA: hypothetical protein VMT87_13640, partial [Vicinamibacteria bacterium]|nr:hypothetical protein [Vicinamibacteria bacterium]